MNNDNFTVLVSGGGSEHVCCVVIVFKMTERVEQQICIKLRIKLEHPFMETLWMIHKALGDNAMKAAQTKL